MSKVDLEHTEEVIEKFLSHRTESSSCTNWLWVDIDHQTLACGFSPMCCTLMSVCMCTWASGGCLGIHVDFREKGSLGGRHKPAEVTVVSFSSLGDHKP